MATASNDSLPLSSFQTAIVFLPSFDVQRQLNSVRSGHDKSFPRWTAHLTAIFPFVEPEHLAAAGARLRAAVSANPLQPFETHLDHVDHFSTRNYQTIYMAPSPTSRKALLAAWNVAASAFNYTGRSFVAHATLGQAYTDDALEFLNDKGSRLVAAGQRWQTDSFVILRKDDEDEGRMKVVDIVSFAPDITPQLSLPARLASEAPFNAFRLDTRSDSWESTAPTATDLDTLRVATFNLMHDDGFPFSDRARRVIDAIVESNADVIALQEMTEDSLRAILSDDLLRQHYVWSSHGPVTVFPLARNLVLLAKSTVPFSWEHVALEDKKKPVAIARIQHSNSQQIVLAAVHLSAGYEPTILAKREKELQALTTYLQQRHANDTTIILGDFNAQPGDSIPLESGSFLDAWEQIDASAATEATFEPSQNELAAHTARRFSNEPRRYDRIFVQSQGVEVLSFARFGIPAAGQAPASDHWGIVTSLRLGPSQSLAEDNESTLAETVDGELTAAQPANLTDAQLTEALHDLTPSSADRQRRTAAVTRLRNVLCGNGQDAGEPSVVRLRLVPVGSFALEVDIVSSDVDCLVIGNISPKAFWSLARHCIKTQSEDNGVPQVKLCRFVNEAAVPMMQLEVDGIAMDMQYSCAPHIAESWTDNMELTDELVLRLPMSALRTLNAYRDVRYLLKTINSSRMTAFRLAHRSLRALAKQRGIFTARLGFVGSFHLSILLVRLLERLPAAGVTAAGLVSLFIQHYSDFDWSREVVQLGTPRAYPRKPREAMVILSPQRPSINVASIASASTAGTFNKALRTAQCLLEGGAAWSTVCGDGLAEFLSTHSVFAKVDVAYWAPDPPNGRGLVGHLESRIVQLLIQLQPTPTSTLTAHFWPQRLADASYSGSSDSLQGFYLIGLSGTTSGSSASTRATILNAFAEDIQTHAKYYDPANAFVMASEFSREQLGDVVPDTFEWPDAGVEADPGSDDSDDGGARDDATEGGTVDIFTRSSAFELDHRKKETKKARKGQQQTRSSASASTSAVTKLRPSVDIYNRLMWDAGVQREDYMIGYEDRFKGVREMPLLSWKREVEDEAFIPFHRVQHFRRKSDNTKVWDREKRLDLVFGSGSAAESTSS